MSDRKRVLLITTCTVGATLLMGLLVGYVGVTRESTTLSAWNIWERYLSQQWECVACLMVMSVCVRLLRNRYVGHRMLIWLVLVSNGLRAVKTASVSIDIYYHGRSTESWMFVLASLGYLLVAFYASANAYHIERSAELTEVAEILRYHKMLNEDSKLPLLQMATRTTTDIVRDVQAQIEANTKLQSVTNRG